MELDKFERSDRTFDRCESTRLVLSIDLSESLLLLSQFFLNLLFLFFVKRFSLQTRTCKETYRYLKT